MAAGKSVTIGAMTLTAAGCSMLTAALLWMQWKQLQGHLPETADFLSVMERPLVLAVGGTVLFSLLAGLWCGHCWRRFSRQLRRASAAARLHRTNVPPNNAYETFSDPDLEDLFSNLEEAQNVLSRYAQELHHTLERMALGDFTTKISKETPESFPPLHDSLESISSSLSEVFLQMSSISKWAIEAAYAIGGASGRMDAAAKTQETLAQSLREDARQRRDRGRKATEEVRWAEDCAQNALGGLGNIRKCMDELRRRADGLYSVLAELSSNVQAAGRFHRHNAMSAMYCVSRSALRGKDDTGYDYTVREVSSCARQGEMRVRQAVTQLAEVTELCEDIWEAADELERLLGDSAERQQVLRDSVQTLLQWAQEDTAALREREKQARMMEALSRSSADCSRLCESCREDLSAQAGKLSRMASSFHTLGNTSGVTSTPIILEKAGEGFTVK